jgi:D-amino-acid dehydrogenase
MLFRKPETGEEEMETVEMAHRLGMEARALTLSEVQAMEPKVTISAAGAIYFPGDMHLSPHSLMTTLRKCLTDEGVVLSIDNEVVGFQHTGSRLTGVKTSLGLLGFDQVVLATGAWSETMGNELGLSIPVQAGKGYSFIADQSQQKIGIPTLLLDDRVAVTPLGDVVRFGGTMEICGVDHSINMARVQGIADAVPRYYPNLKIDMPSATSVWHGLRPCSPDGLPYIGRSKRFENLLIATGHGMMGVSLGPGTGCVIADLINEVRPEVGIAEMDPARFD